MLTNNLYSGGVQIRIYMKYLNKFRLSGSLPLACFVMLTGSLHSTALYSQEANNNIETITITGARSPILVPQVAGSVTIIDEAQIKASGAITMIDILRTVPGVNVAQNGPIGALAEVRFRGTESNHVMVLLDGVAINDLGQASLADFTHLLLSNIERIEILRGPQSAIWGSNAIAGIISITTKQASANNTNVEVNLGIGNSDTYQSSAHASKQTQDYALSLNASTYSTAGENISRQGNENDGYKNTQINGRFNYVFSAYNRVDLNARLLNYTSESDNYDASTGLVSDGNAKAKGEHTSLGINWHFAPTDNGKKSGIYSQLLSLQYAKQVTDNFADDIFARASQGETLRILWSNRFEFTQDKWINLGIENTQEDFKQRGSLPTSGENQSQSNDTLSLVSDGLYAVNNKISISGSVRRDNNDIFDNATSYRLGATFALNNNWRMFASRGRAIKNPTFVERFGFFPQFFLGNPNLQPEQQTSSELGLEADFTNTSIKLNWFKADLTNEILGFVFDPSSGQFTAQNAMQDSERQGLEFSIQSQFADVQWQANFTYLDASENDEAEIRRARNTGSLSGTYQINPKHQVYLQADYTGTKFDTFFPPDFSPAQTVSMRAYWLVSANYQYTHSKHIQLNLRFSNALNEKYEDVLGYSAQGSRALLNARIIW